ncbi:MAG: hypothetical protein WCP04_07610 [Pseudomonadota bacterium]
MRHPGAQTGHGQSRPGSPYAVAVVGASLRDAVDAPAMPGTGALEATPAPSTTTLASCPVSAAAIRAWGMGGDCSAAATAA